eukprot:gene7112-5118_t
MQILCQDNLINADFNHDSDKCYEEASSMIFVYMIVWFIMFWGYSFPTLQRLKQREILGDGGEIHSANIPANKVISSGGAVQQPKTVSDFMGRFADSQFYLSAKKVIASPAIIAVMVALFIGLIPALQYQFFSSDGGLYVIGSAMDTVGEPVVALNTLIMAASLAQCDFPVHKVQQYVDRFLFSDTSAHDSLVRKPMLAPEPRVGEFGGIEEPDTPVDNMSEDIETDIVQPYSAFPVSSDEDVALPGEIPEKGLVSPSSATPAKELPPLRSVLALIICRLFLPPLVMLMVNPIFISLGLISKDQRLMLLIIMLESCSPSAQVLIVALNQLGITSAASSMSYMYVFLYGTSIFTVTLWTTVAMSVYY